MGDFLGIPLTTFGLVIGWISAICALIYTFLISMGFAQLDEVVKVMRQHYDFSHADSRWLRNFVIRTLCVSLVINLLGGIAAVLLILGITQRRAAYMIFFLAIMVGNIVLSISAFCYHLLSRSTAGTVCLQVWILLVQCLIFYPIYLLFMEISNGHV